MSLFLSLPFILVPVLRQAPSCCGCGCDLRLASVQRPEQNTVPSPFRYTTCFSVYAHHRLYIPFPHSRPPFRSSSLAVCTQQTGIYSLRRLPPVASSPFNLLFLTILLSIPFPFSVPFSPPLRPTIVNEARRGYAINTLSQLARIY